MLKSDLRKIVAVALVLTTTLITMPLSGADFPIPTRPVIGSVSAVGPVELRGIRISQEGTLFAGDNIRAEVKGYAKVLLGDGGKIELAENTEVNVNHDAQGVKIAMNAGTVGFTSGTSLRIDALPFEVTATDGAAGNIAIMSSTVAGVRAINGKVSVRNLKTSESFVVSKGQERLLGLSNGAHTPSLAELASNVPGPIPAPVPQAPAGRSAGGLSLDTGAWIAIIGGAAVTGVAVWALLTAFDNRSDNKVLKNNIKDLNSTIAANQVAAAAALKNVSNLTIISNSLGQELTQLSLISTLAGQARNALINAGNNDSAAAEALSIGVQAADSAQRIQALQSQIQGLQTAGGGSSAQVLALLQAEEVERQNANGLAGRLNNLLASNRGVAGVPQTAVGFVTTGPTLATASVPV